MDFIKSLIKKHPFFSLIFPTSLGGLSFFSHILSALSDGIIDSSEFHQLLTGASGLQMFLLMIIMAALRHDKDKTN